LLLLAGLAGEAGHAATLAEETETLAVAVAGALVDGLGAVVAHPAVLANTLNAALGGGADAVQRAGAVAGAAQFFRTGDSSPSGLADAEVLAAADTVLRATLGAGGGLRAVIASVVGLAEALAVEALSVGGAAAGAEGGLVAGRSLEAGEAEAATTIAETATVAVVSARHLECAVVSSIAGVADAAAANAGAGATALLGAVGSVGGVEGLVIGLRAVSALVGRHAVALSVDADTAERALVGAGERLHHLRAIGAGVASNARAGAVQANTDAAAAVGARRGGLEKGLDGGDIEAAGSVLEGDGRAVARLVHGGERSRVLALLAVIAAETLAATFNANTVATASVGAAGLLVARRALEAAVAVAGAAQTETAGGAGTVAGAGQHGGAGGAGATLVTDALAVVAGAVAAAGEAVGGAGALNDFRAVSSEVATNAVALAANADTLSGAVVEARRGGDLGGAVSTAESGRAEAHTVQTEAAVGAVVGAARDLSAGLSGEAGVAIAFAAVAGAVSSADLIAELGAGEDGLAVISSETGLAEAATELAFTAARAFAGAAFDRAVDAFVARRTGADAVETDTVSAAVVAADSAVLVVAGHERLEKLLA